MMKVIDGSPQQFCCDEMKDHWEKSYGGVGADEYRNCRIFILAGGGFQHDLNITHCPWCGEEITSMVNVQ